MTVGLLLTSFTLGLRHGVDWDHIAAIADLSASAGTRRRGFVLSFLYAAAHALVVFVLGVVAVIFGAGLPSSVDQWMARAVGLTLVGLGVWIVTDLMLHRREFRLRSRWILILSGTFAGLRRIRDASRRRRVSVEHVHAHDHEPGLLHEQPVAHDHAHLSSSVEAAIPVSAGFAASAPVSRDVRSGHRHRHRHELVLGEAAVNLPGNGTAAGIGLLHGIGFESPTQIAVFVASTSVVGATAGLTLLAAWVGGLLLANTALAALAGAGLLNADRNFRLYVAIALVVASVSVVMGAFLLLDAGSFP